MQANRRSLLDWWIDDPANPGRASMYNPAVQRLAAEVAPGCDMVDLGGTMSLNLRLDPAGLVLRVHQPFVSRRRLLALQAVRRKLADLGLAVPVPVDRNESSLFWCGDRWYCIPARHKTVCAVVCRGQAHRPSARGGRERRAVAGPYGSARADSPWAILQGRT